MVRIITVEREYGSRGGEFAHLLADYLGWRIVDNCIVDEIAHKIGLDKRTVANCDERLDPWYYRLGKSFWHASVERMPAVMSSAEVFDSERLTRLIREYLKERVAEGNCVVVGRGAASALINIPGTFHIFVYASTARKMAWFRDQFPDRADEAQQELEATDRRRANYIRRFYNQEWNDYRLYQLMLNSCMGFPAMIGVAMEAVGLSHNVNENALPPTAHLRK